MTTSKTVEKTNPLLTSTWLPHFKAIKTEDIEPAVRQILEENKKELQALLSQPAEHFSWDSLMQPLDEMGERLSQAWSPVSHLHSVLQSDPLRDAYNVCLPWITEYHTLLMQSQALYQAIEALAQTKFYTQFDFAQKKTIEHALRDFRLSGVHLSTEKKEELLELEKKLSQLSTQFSENLLDATQNWFHTIHDPKQLAGLPESARELAKKNAEQRGVQGWVLGLDYPSYSAAMKFLEDRELRKILYEAFSTRASDQGPQAGQWDNSELMSGILKARHQSAQLVGFKNYAEYSLATKDRKS